MALKQKICCLLVLLACAGLAVSACAPATPTWADADGAAPQTAAALETAAAPGEQPVQAAQAQAVQPAQPALSNAGSSGADADSAISRFAIYYDATQAMMGFVDVPPQQANHYVTALDLLRNRSLFPLAQYSAYRVDHEAKDPSTLLLDSGTIANWIGRPLFYLSADAVKEPETIVLQGDTSPRAGRRLNRFMDSFYTASGSPLRAEQQTKSPVAYAVSNVQENDITVVVSDLSEIYFNEAALVDQLGQKVFQKDMSFAIMGVKSSFAGFVPLKAADTIWVQWGSVPSASPEVVYEYREVKADGKLGIAYDVPMTSVASERTVRQRPFYILCMGKTDALAEYSNVLIHQLESRGAECTYLLYANDYVNHQFDLPSNASLTPGDGVRENQVVRNGLYLTDTGDKRNRESRSLVVSVHYDALAIDPRYGGFTPEDFVVELSIVQAAQDGQAEKAVAPSGGVALALERVAPDASSIDMRLTVPVDSLPKGKYRVGMKLSMKQPDLDGYKDAFASFSAQAGSAANQYDSFDGSRTLALDSLIDHINQIQAIRGGLSPIGTYELELDVLK